MRFSFEAASGSADRERRLLGVALGLAVATVAFNLVEGAVSVYLGISDETLALFGFGIDSFIEVISGVGIVHLVVRIGRDRSARRDGFERTALRITGTAFYLLTAGLLVSAGYSLIARSSPETTFWGVVVASVSIFAMYVLIRAKMYVGSQLGSDAIVADAKCTRACLQMSAVLLGSSLIFELTGLGFVDAIGSAGIALLSYREGRECFEKARGKSCGDCKCD